MKPMICPVCKGLGTVPVATKAALDKPCHGCDGKGWVEVSETDGWIEETVDPRVNQLRWDTYPWGCGHWWVLSG